MTERYCDELVAEMENFGKWSDGSNDVSLSSSSSLLSSIEQSSKVNIQVSGSSYSHVVKELV